ncbi:peroxidase-like protein 3 [Uloborus diversus]|uniref:peroxidase-like protein 3 n=1 Tax=Uloborus diversus TaxID=327109 RepID=UPI00240A1BBF|nr:peroxidase-like protein 3 [Uloborus diversus]
MQIKVSQDDPFYGPRNVTCLNLLRSIPVRGECMGRREQLNGATSFLDASTIYGSSVQHLKSLRSFSKGQLKTQMINNVPFMAFKKLSGYACGTPKEPLKCFSAGKSKITSSNLTGVLIPSQFKILSGDSRANMMVEMTAIHVLWYREHNRIASALHKLNLNWTDEILFQETRKILIAELQHITYNEFLPLLLGDKALEEHELKINPNQTYDGYDDTIDPSVYNVFGAAAFRFGHSLAQDELVLYGHGDNEEDQVLLHETFFNPHLIYHNGLDLLIRGATLQRTHSVDSYITTEVREHLFQPVELDYGHDLSAVGIQRGRDHGLPGYTKWREVCGLSSIDDWDDLYEVMDKMRADNLKAVYESVDDIDFIPGALAENHVEGSLLGPTHTCVIGRQFKKTRKGDRLWFENRNQIESFTEDQLKEIYKSSVARIICDNADSIHKVQKHPFEMPSESNPIVSCQDISSVDLSKWS